MTKNQYKILHAVLDLKLEDQKRGDVDAKLVESGRLRSQPSVAELEDIVAFLADLMWARSQQ